MTDKDVITNGRVVDKLDELLSINSSLYNDSLFAYNIYDSRQSDLQ